MGQQQEKTVAEVAAPGLLLTDDELTKLYEGSKCDALPVGSEVRQMVGEIRWHRARANTPASKDFVLVPREATEAMLDVMHDRIRILVDPEARTADIQNDRELWSALLAAAPASPEPAVVASVNVNDSVWVKLTDEGRAHHQRHYETRYPMLKYRAPDESADGWSKWQIWSLMQEFGEAIYMGGPVPFETTIRFASPEPASNEAPGRGGVDEEMLGALEGLIRYADAVRMTAGMGSNQLARLNEAKAIVAARKGPVA